MRARKLTLAALSAVLVVAAVPAAAPANPKPSANVCNEAENSWQGGYTVTGDPVDPNPPARLLGSQMRVGNGHGRQQQRRQEESTHVFGAPRRSTPTSSHFAGQCCV